MEKKKEEGIKGRESERGKTPEKEKEESRGRGQSVTKESSVREARQSNQKQMHGEKPGPLGRGEVDLCWAVVSSRRLK